VDCGRAVELSFGDGAKELVDAAELRVRTGEDGTARYAVLRGRQWSVADAETAAQLLKLAQDAEAVRAHDDPNLARPRRKQDVR
jgi:hypothetical protein